MTHMASGSVLVVDNDQDIAELVRAVLADEGYAVDLVVDVSVEAISAAVGRLEPDAVLLDGESHVTGYGGSWAVAAHLATRERRVPVIMFTAHSPDLREAEDGKTPRSVAASFAAFLPKPFDVDHLLTAVAKAVGRSIPFDGSPGADAARSAALAARVEEIGGQDVRPSARREWVTFRTPSGRFMQIYWWQAGGSYLIGRYDDSGAHMENVSRTFDREAAIALCERLVNAEPVPD